MSSLTDEFVIRGVTLAGKPFRPSDWAERLCGVMSAFGSDGRMQYSPYVYPVTSEGTKCVVVDVRLKDIEPMAASANPKRFTDQAKTEKWFGRNCNNVLGRECMPTEKGDFITFMLAQ